MLRSLCHISAFVILISTFGGCKQSDSTITPTSKAATYFGESKPFGGDSIRSWIKTDLNGVASSIGVTFSQAAFSRVETEHDSVFMLELPPLVSGMNSALLAPPFDHVFVRWVSVGDSIQHLLVPHLGVYFYTIDSATQIAIPATKNIANFELKYVPNDYVADLVSEAHIGLHWVDTTGSEYHGQPFLHALFYGVNAGDYNYVEPAFAKTYIDTKTNFSADIKQPAAFMRSGMYPTKYYLRYDSQLMEYSISIDNLVSR